MPVIRSLPTTRPKASTAAPLSCSVFAVILSIAIRGHPPCTGVFLDAIPPSIAHVQGPVTATDFADASHQECRHYQARLHLTSIESARCGVRRAIRRRGADSLRQPGRAAHRPGRHHRVRRHLVHVHGRARRSHPGGVGQGVRPGPLLDQARHAGRDFVGILFSAADKIQVFPFPAGRSASPRCSTSRKPSSVAAPATRRP